MTSSFLTVHMRRTLLISGFLLGCLSGAGCSPGSGDPANPSATSSGGTAGSGTTGSGTTGSGTAGSGAGGAGTGGAGGASAMVDGGSGGDGASSPTTLEGACRAGVMTQCERRLACNGDQVAYGQCQQYAELCPAYYFSDGTTRTLESVQACIAQLRQLSCTDLALQILPACIAGGRRTAGQPCIYHSQCESVYCQGGISACGQCDQPVATGAACMESSGSACRETDFCKDGICVATASVAHGKMGDPCSPTPSTAIKGCEGDLVCDASGTCQPRPAMGQPCATDRFSTRLACAKGLVCTNSVCDSPGKCGSTICDADSYCKKDGTTETCAPRVGEGGRVHGRVGDLRSGPDLHRRPNGCRFHRRLMLTRRGIGQRLRRHPPVQGAIYL